MSAPTYEGLPAHKVALERRLRNICEASGLNELRTRTAFAHAVVAQMLPAGVVKGGAAIKLRVGDTKSRVTTDLDVARAARHSLESYEAELTDSLGQGWSRFTGRVVKRAPADPDDVPDEYVMQPFDIKLAYASHAFVTVELELGHDEVGSTTRPRMALDAEIADIVTRLGFPALEPIPVLAVEHQVAQKLHACTTPDRYGGNQRAHDLVDLQVLVAADPPDLRELAKVGRRLFVARRVASWPPTVRAWPGWQQRYDESARDLGVRSLADAIYWLHLLVDSAEQLADNTSDSL